MVQPPRHLQIHSQQVEPLPIYLLTQMVRIYEHLRLRDQLQTCLVLADVPQSPEDVRSSYCKKKEKPKLHQDLLCKKKKIQESSVVYLRLAGRYAEGLTRQRNLRLAELNTQIVASIKLA